MPATASTGPCGRSGDLVADLDGEHLLLLGQHDPDRRGQPVAAMESDGARAGLAHGEANLVEDGFLHARPPRHGGRDQAGRPDVFGLGAEAQFNGGHARPPRTTGVP